mmetsp:Transcript_30169/g.76232  ORF Transcript_30169/g.76232 Transcript_30169/m.76232 type:complete len:187 (+) Transcript_30169:3-563(+)
MEFLEKLLGDSADKHELAFQALYDAHNQFEAKCGKQAKDLDALKALHAHHATMAERLDYLEQLLGDSADKHATELAALKAKQAKTADALAKHAKDSSAALAHHATVGERIDYIEQCIGDSADMHVRQLESLKQAHDNHAKDLSLVKDLHGRLSSGQKEVQAKHLSVAERLEVLERRLRHCFDTGLP